MSTTLCLSKIEKSHNSKKNNIVLRMGMNQEFMEVPLNQHTGEKTKLSVTPWSILPNLSLLHGINQ
jgi:hypothetical protein